MFETFLNVVLHFQKDNRGAKSALLQAFKAVCTVLGNPLNPLFFQLRAIWFLYMSKHDDSFGFLWYVFCERTRCSRNSALRCTIIKYCLWFAQDAALRECANFRETKIIFIETAHLNEGGTRITGWCCYKNAQACWA